MIGCRQTPNRFADGNPNLPAVRTARRAKPFDHQQNDQVSSSRTGRKDSSHVEETGRVPGVLAHSGRQLGPGVAYPRRLASACRFASRRFEQRCAISGRGSRLPVMRCHAFGVDFADGHVCRTAQHPVGLRRGVRRESLPRHMAFRSLQQASSRRKPVALKRT